MVQMSGNFTGSGPEARVRVKGNFPGGVQCFWVCYRFKHTSKGLDVAAQPQRCRFELSGSITLGSARRFESKIFLFGICMCLDFETKYANGKKRKLPFDCHNFYGMGAGLDLDTSADRPYPHGRSAFVKSRGVKFCRISFLWRELHLFVSRWLEVQRRLARLSWSLLLAFIIPHVTVQFEFIGMQIIGI